MRGHRVFANYGTCIGEQSEYARWPQYRPMVSKLWIALYSAEEYNVKGEVGQAQDNQY
jgi:hypothetical protein